MQVATNIRVLRDDDTLGEYRDIDCYACANRRPGRGLLRPAVLDEASLAHVVRADVEVYGIDLPQLAAKALRLAMR